MTTSYDPESGHTRFSSTNAVSSEGLRRLQLPSKLGESAVSAADNRTPISQLGDITSQDWQEFLESLGPDTPEEKK